jgi:hypothetical protein
MERFCLIASAALFALGCSETSLGTVPNKVPIAQAFVGEAAAGERLGYFVNGSTARLDGSLSSDQNDLISALTFTWTFVTLPEGSALTAESIVKLEDDPETDVFEGAMATFTPDLLGTYRVDLVVSDPDQGVSQPAPVIVQSVPPSNLSVELTWEQGGADLDLHVLAPGGTYFSDSDVFSWNPNPNWGSPDLATDNPRLDDDADGEGGGPFRELITLEAPTDGDYQIWVHYYSDHVLATTGEPVPANATVTVRVFDELLEPILQQPEPLLQGDVWKVASLQWPDRVLSQMAVMSDHSAEGGPTYND